MTRAVAVTLCLGLLGCTTTRLTSLVTVQAECPAKAPCPPPIQEKREGACVEQTAEPGFRVVDCISAREERFTGAGVALGAAAVLGAVALLYLSVLGVGLSKTH
jgi:hypothetical protein